MLEVPEQHITMDNSRCTVTGAPLAQLDRASQLLDPTCLNDNVLPPLVKSLLHLFRHVDDLRGGNDLVPSVDETIKDLIEPERVLSLAKFLQILDLASVEYVAFPSKRCDRTDVRVHCPVHESSVIVTAENVARPVIPVDPDAFHRRFRIFRFGVDEFHDTAKVVGLAGWFTDEIDMIWKTIRLDNLCLGNKNGKDRSEKISSGCRQPHQEMDSIPLTARTVPSSASSFPSFSNPLHFPKKSMFVSRWAWTAAAFVALRVVVWDVVCVAAA